MAYHDDPESFYRKNFARCGIRFDLLFLGHGFDVRIRHERETAGMVLELLENALAET